MSLADRAAGCLVGLAYGDALGVPYEYGSRPLPGPGELALLGGGLGNFEPGEWSDDTQMAVCIAQAAAVADLRTDAGLDAVAVRFEDWYAGRPADVGIQTSRVLRAAELLDGAPAHRLRTAARALHEESGRTAGNGALMRTAPVALALLGDPDAIARVAREVAELTHPDPLAGDSCVLWCLAIDAALRGGGPPRLLDHVAALPDSRRADWARWIQLAESGRPADFPENGFTVTALQAAWSAFWGQPDTGFAEIVDAAIHAGDDTDTVGAIAGSLAGASCGLEAIPAGHRERLHGWPGLTAVELAELAARLVARD